MTELYQLPTDICAEFLVKEDGRVVARSWSAVARLAGVSLQTIRDRLIPRINVESAKTLPKSLQPLSGMDLSGSASEISEVVISCIINYYAWESKAANDQAKHVALALNAMGIRAYFQKALGWHEPKTVGMSEFNELKAMMAHLISEFAAFRTTATRYPGITNIVQNNTNILILPTEFKEPFSIREWVSITQGRNLTSGECRSIGRMASSTMTTLKLESPLKYGTAKVYRYSDMPALQTIWQSWLLTSK